MTRGTADVQVSPNELGLNPTDLIAIYRDMFMARAVSERLWLLGRQGKVYFLVSCEGHEAAQVGSVYGMRPGTDIFVPYYRDLAVALAVGSEPKDMVLHALGKAADPYSGGRQLPGHYSSKERNIISGSSCVATQILHGVGTAFASKYRGEDVVSITYFGDGATSKGDFHEAMNFAAVHKLPVIFFCENNGWAISVPQSRQMVVQDISGKAEGYGMPGVTVEGMNVLDVVRATREARDRASRGEGPTLIEAKVHRFSSHSSNDDHRRYRTPEELNAERESDPVARYRNLLIDLSVLDEARAEELEEEVIRVLDEAVDSAEASPDPIAGSAYTQIYSTDEV